jgi:predicted O-methyltransferase YrrM
MKTNVTEELYQYALKIARDEHPILKELRLETSTMPGAHMEITPDQGQFMTLLAQIINARKYLEIGVFTGYSSLTVALGMGTNGHTYALDNNPKVLEIAKKYWQKANLTDNITMMCDDALISLASLVQSGHNNSFDMAFMDAKKSDYIQYLEYCYNLIRTGGIILIDNVFMNGDVIKQPLSNIGQDINKFNKFIKDDQRFDICVTTIADGLTIARKRY